MPLLPGCSPALLLAVALVLVTIVNTGDASVSLFTILFLIYFMYPQ